jgi:hypothetical protein
MQRKTDTIRSTLLHSHPKSVPLWICDQPRALHNFSEYRDNSRIVILHFEYFICGASRVRCSVSGCLHEVFTLSRGGRYKLTGRYYSKEPFR